MSFAAVSAGTALAWTSPIEAQLNETTIPSVTADQSEWKRTKLLINCRQSDQRRYHFLIENNNQVTSIN